MAGRSTQQLREYYRDLLDGRWDPTMLPGLIDEWDPRFGCVTDACLTISDDGSNQTLSMTATDLLRGAAATWWRAGWVKPTATNPSNFFTAARDGGGQNGYTLQFANLTTLRLDVGTGSGNAAANISDTFVQDTWYFVYFGFDGTNIFVSVDDGTPSTAVAAFSPEVGGDFEVGSYDAAHYADADMQNFCGGNGNLSAGQIAALAANPAHEDIPGIIGTTDTFCFPLSEEPGARLDTIGGLSLTAVNAPGVAQGVSTGAAVNNSPVKTWTGRRNGIVISQAVLAAQPLWIASGQNSAPVLRFDGVDDVLAKTSAFGASGPKSMYFYGKSLDAGASTNLRFITCGGQNACVIKNNTTLGYFANEAAGTTDLGGAAQTAFVCGVRIASTSSLKAQVNAAAEVTLDPNDASVTTRDCFVGAQNATSGELNCDIGDIILTDADSTDEEFQSAMDYIGAPYGVPT